MLRGSAGSCNTPSAMSLLSASWPRCPEHFTWMQPNSNPREWRCNVLVERRYWDDEIGVRLSKGTAMCSQSERYRWWNSLDRKVFSILRITIAGWATGSYYCPVCEDRFFLNGQTAAALPPPYFRLCLKCAYIGTEHEKVGATTATTSKALSAHP
jgi:hypothetical protein